MEDCGLGGGGGRRKQLVRRWNKKSGRRAEEEDAKDEEREGAAGLKLELTNAKELSGISHLIRRATRLRDSLARESAREEAWRNKA